MSGARRRVRTTIRAALVPVLAIAAAMAGSIGAAAPAAAFASAGPVVTDDRGVQVRLAQPARRIVTLLPSLTETVCALEACDRLVATDRWSNWPAEAAALPKAGGLDDTNVELVVAQRPDLVLVGRSARVAERLEALGLRVAAFEPRTLADIGRVMRAVGTLAGAAHADTLARELDGAVEAAARTVPPAARGLAVYFEVDTAPYAAGPGSFVGELLARLGAANVVPVASGPFPKLNPEFVVRADPQVIVVAARHAAGLAQRPGWSTIRALQPAGGRVCAFGPADFEVLVRPGPRAPLAARLLAGCLSGAAAAR